MNLLEGEFNLDKELNSPCNIGKGKKQIANVGK